jgi:hypothetical protein
MALQSPFGVNQFYTDTGVMAAAYLLYAFESGTTTPKATFQDQGEIASNAHPIVLSAAGRCSLWLGTGEYTFVLKTPGGATVWTLDDISGLVVSSSGSFLPLSGGTLTGALTLAANASASLHPVALQQMTAAIAASAVSDAGLLAAAIATEVTNRNTAISTAVGAIISGTIASPGSVTLTDGTQTLIVKWGTTGSLTIDTANNVITFATAFPTNCFAVIGSASSANGISFSAANYSMSFHTFSTTGFRVDNDATTGTATWIAIGN